MMINKIVLCVLIYFELVASHPYGAEYLEANQPPRQRLQFSNLQQQQNVPPGLFNQNAAFRTETGAQTRPFYDNVGSYRVPETRTALTQPMQQGQKFNSFQLPNPQTFLPVQQPSPNQNRLSNQFTGHQARPQNVPQFQAQYTGVPGLNSVAESHIAPLQRQYQSIQRPVENLGQTAALRPQYYVKQQILQPTNRPPTPINIQPLHKYQPVNIERVNGNVGVGVTERIVKNEQNVPSNLQITNLGVTGNNNLQRIIMQNPKLKEILATTKNKKRYMVIHPNGEVEHVDSLEKIMATHPNNVININAATAKQIMGNLLPVVQPATLPPLASNAAPSAPGIVLAPPAPLTLPAVPLQQNPTPKMKSPVVTSVPSPPKPNVIKPVQPVPTNPPVLSPYPTKLNVNSAARPKLSATNFVHPNVPNVITKPPSAIVPSPSKTPMPSHPNPPIQLQSSYSVPSTNHKESVIHPLADSKNNESSGNTPLHPPPTSDNYNVGKQELPPKPLPVTITELSPTSVANNHPATPTKLSASDESKRLPLKPLSSSSATAPKPVALASPTPPTPSAPINLADLFPPTNEDTPKRPEVSNISEPTGLSTATTKPSSSKPSTDSPHNIVDKQVANEASGDSSDNMQSDSESNEVKRKESTAVVNDSKNSKTSSSTSTLSSEKSSQSTEVQSEAKEMIESSASHTDTREDESTQKVYKTVSETDSSSSDVSSSHNESSNSDDETTAHKLPSIVMLTAPFCTTDSEEDSETAENHTHGTEVETDKIQGKKNMTGTLPSYEEIWEKLVKDGLVNVMYFIEMPAQNKYEYDDENEKDYE